jgi:hypothetical protein
VPPFYRFRHSVAVGFVVSLNLLIAHTLIMKINNLEPFKVPPRWLFLKITTDEGLAGGVNRWWKVERIRLLQPYPNSNAIYKDEIRTRSKTSGR